MSHPLPKPRARGITAKLRTLVAPGDSVWVPIAMRGIGQAAAYAGLNGRYTARKEGEGVRVWLLPTP